MEPFDELLVVNGRSVGHMSNAELIEFVRVQSAEQELNLSLRRYVRDGKSFLYLTIFKLKHLPILSYLYPCIYHLLFGFSLGFEALPSQGSGKNSQFLFFRVNDTF